MTSTRDTPFNIERERDEDIPSVPARAWTRHCWWILFAALLLSHAVWVVCDDAPPAWDMAHHQLRGMHAWEALVSGELPAAFPRLSDYYPPLYYLQEAIVLGFFGWTLLPLLANLPGLFLLVWCGRRLAREFLDEPAASLAAIVTPLLPMVAWLSRESLLDVSLAGWVAASLVLLRRTHGLTERNPALLFGLSLAAGMLTKWTFVGFVALPIVWTWWRSPDRRAAALRLIEASALAALPILWWYLPNAENLIERFRLTSAAGTAENDPSWTNLSGWLYYPRCLISYYFGLPLTLAAAGLWLRFRASQRPRTEEEVYGRGMPRLEPIAAEESPSSLGPSHFALRTSEASHFELRTFLLVWLFGGILALTFLPAKDPRYVMPVALPAVLLMLHSLRDRRRAAAVIAAVAAVQCAIVSFPLTPPFKLALFEFDPPSDYRTLSREWVLIQTHYFDVVGPPRNQDWGLGEMASRLNQGDSVGFLPELPRFHVLALKLAAARTGKRIEVIRLGESSADIGGDLRAIVAKTGDQGIPHLTVYNGEVRRRMNEGNWRMEASWPLPDGSLAEWWVPAP